MIRLSPQLRAGIQRSTLPALILLSGAMLVAGKTDQTMFETLRTVMINAGSQAGLARGQAVITGDGLVGRLTEVGSRAARVLLITDLNSRIPVKIEGSNTGAVLAGDNSERPRLLYVGSPEALKI